LGTGDVQAFLDIRKVWALGISGEFNLLNYHVSGQVKTPAGNQLQDTTTALL
jgi:hypothetical protein